MKTSYGYYDMIFNHQTTKIEKTLDTSNQQDVIWIDLRDPI